MQFELHANKIAILHAAQIVVPRREALHLFPGPCETRNPTHALDGQRWIAALGLIAARTTTRSVEERPQDGPAGVRREALNNAQLNVVAGPIAKQTRVADARSTWVSSMPANASAWMSRLDRRQAGTQERKRLEQPGQRRSVAFRDRISIYMMEKDHIAHIRGHGVSM